jgi:hypothetical protein
VTDSTLDVILDRVRTRSAMADRAAADLRLSQPVTDSLQDVPWLLAAVDAVLALADQWADSAAIECPGIAIREAVLAALGEGGQ